MFSSNLTLKATIQAEKAKEREENRQAARYVKIRALLDEAEKAIHGSNIARSLKNQLIAKLFKARKALDTGLNVEEVIAMMTMIVTMINNEIRMDKKSLERTTNEMKQNLDTFYKYDYDKFVKKETERMKSEYLASRSELLRRRSRSQLPREESKVFGDHKRSSSVFGCKDERMIVEKPANPMLLETPSGRFEKTPISSVREEPSRTSVNVEDDMMSDGESDDSKRDVTGAGIDSLREEQADDDDPSIKHYLETLTVSLSILQDIPKLELSKDQYSRLITSMRATKEMLMTLHGCAALAEPMSKLRQAIDGGFNNMPQEPLLSQALLDINDVVSSFTTNS